MRGTIRKPEIARFTNLIRKLVITSRAAKGRSIRDAEDDFVEQPIRMMIRLLQHASGCEVIYTRR